MLEKKQQKYYKQIAAWYRIGVLSYVCELPPCPQLRTQVSLEFNFSIKAGKTYLIWVIIIHRKLINLRFKNFIYLLDLGETYNFRHLQKRTRHRTLNQDNKKD